MLNAKFESSKGILRVQMRRNLLCTNQNDFVDSFEALWDVYCKENWSVFLLDMNYSKMVDSSGLNTLHQISEFLTQKGKKLKILISSSSIRRVFSISLFDQKVEVVMRERRRRKE
jgi:anti-anti-sigma regulatory factor